MDPNAVTDFIAKVGFPIAVTTWLLWERYRVMGRLAELMSKMVEIEDHERELLERLEARMR